MAQLPNVDQDISLLRRFIQGVADLPTNPSAALEAAETNAEVLLRRLENPVRIAVAGLSGAGKTSLVNLLLGEALVPNGTESPVQVFVYHHADAASTTAGWWDRPSKVFQGHNLTAALHETPDLISFGVDSPILKTLQLVDVSGLDEPGKDKEAVLALTQLADVLIWCSRADEPLSDEQMRLVKLLPNRLTKNSLLVLTHADEMAAEHRDSAATEILDRPGVAFLHVSHLATPQAWSAFHGEGDDPTSQWAASGAPETLAALIDVATQARQKEVDKVQRSIAKQIIPFLTQVPLPPEEAATAPETPAPAEPTAPKAAAPEPTPAPAIEPAPVPEAEEGVTGTDVLLDEWLGRLADLYEKIENGEIEENDDLVQGVQELVSDYLDDLADSDELPAELDWLIADYEKANDLMVLLQFESSDHVAKDAARILAQLTDSLCHV